MMSTQARLGNTTPRIFKYHSPKNETPFYQNHTTGLSRHTDNPRWVVEVSSVPKSGDPWEVYSVIRVDTWYFSQ